MIKIIISLLMLLWTAISQEIKSCPQRNGIFPNSDDCNTFILCNNFVSVLKSCPNGLHFNPTLKVCDFPEQSGCKSGSKTDTFECPEGISLFQDPLDCHWFYTCSDGRSHHFECPAGLIFYPQLNRCDYPETNGFFCFDSENKFPNTSDCRMYLDCSKPIEGYACPRLCPQNLQFNRYLEECVTPDNSLCVNQSGDQLNHSNNNDIDDTNDDSIDESNSLPDLPDPQEPKDPWDPDYFIDKNNKYKDYIEILIPPNLSPNPELNQNL